MWNSPNQRVRSILQSQQRERMRARQPLHVKRVYVQTEFKKSTLHQNWCRLLLNDLSMQGLNLFSPSPYVIGQEGWIHLQVREGLKLSLPVKVVWCKEYAANSRVLSKYAYGFRIGFQFLFQNPEEEERFKFFYQDVTQSYVYSLS